MMKYILYVAALAALAGWLHAGYNEDQQFVKEYHACVDKKSINPCYDELKAKRENYKQSKAGI